MSEFKIALILLFAVALLSLAIPVEADPEANRPLFGNVFTDLNGDGQQNANEPAAIGVVIEARNYDSSDARIWNDTSTAPGGDYHLSVPDRANYDVVAYCPHSDGNLSSMRECWRSVSPVAIHGAGVSVNVPLQPQRLYLPLVCRNSRQTDSETRIPLNDWRGSGYEEVSR